jgi:hypothetical protein
MSKKNNSPKNKPTPAAKPATTSTPSKPAKAPRKSWVAGQTARLAKALKTVAKVRAMLGAGNPSKAAESIAALDVAKTQLETVNTNVAELGADWKPTSSSKLSIGDQVMVKVTATDDDSPIFAHYRREDFKGAKITGEDGGSWIVQLTNSAITTIRKKLVTAYTPAPNANPPEFANAE